MENELVEELEALRSIYSPEEVDASGQSDGKPVSVTVKIDKQPVVTFALTGEPMLKYIRVNSYSITITSSYRGRKSSDILRNQLITMVIVRVSHPRRVWYCSHERLLANTMKGQSSVKLSLL